MLFLVQAQAKARNSFDQAAPLDRLNEPELPAALGDSPALPEMEAPPNSETEPEDQA
jgi:hypothetical protein